MLWFLHFASEASQVVQRYIDEPIGVGEVSSSGAGRFVSAILRPHIVLGAGSDETTADALHSKIHEVCFIARSVRFPVTIEATYESTAQ
jgi:organic hydroperoxide reductase OsmC/OhrA